MTVANRGATPRHSRCGAWRPPKQKNGATPTKLKVLSLKASHLQAAWLAGGSQHARFDSWDRPLLRSGQKPFPNTLAANPVLARESQPRLFEDTIRSLS